MGLLILRTSSRITPCIQHNLQMLTDILDRLPSVFTTRTTMLRSPLYRNITTPPFNYDSSLIIIPIRILVHTFNAPQIH